ncbi:glycoside hydrolase family 3 C-terminal domain-containing protein [Lacrimispora xylanolytica]|uniref:Glycoside hydrolase family 3 C-terminal domain-containing protein n=1 Tax=Lacrimispora xylanolytica TaxID=29375 RepID=A0ABY7AEG5_9FIRM|nr:glycoside hydrolase family 3 N-terminal domain-containing protein [Lacrimispora xylanolytica]WAJ24183.1 glycoside hydrolase family 3 C-terminal domain-containing protein [Lacrimispora xylanolytica]
MLQINIDDVMNIVKLCAPYLIGLGIALAAIIAVFIACRKKIGAKKYLIRSQGIMAMVLALIITVNLICWGPMASLISLATGSGTITEETSNKATELCTEIAEEGIVLLKNDSSLLPLKADANLNVFGWASTNPCYGGTGSGSLSDAYETVSLLKGLEDAGFKLNNALSDFYKEYRADRPSVGMWAQDWTLPEPVKTSYSQEMLSGAKSFSDTAMVVITRVGGEGADLPSDVSKVTYTDNSKDYKDFEAGDHYLQLSKTEKDLVDLVCSNFDNVILVYNGANAMELGFLNEYKQIKSAIWCPGTGQSGFEALGEIISGDINPSGKTSDTFVKDLTKTPEYNNFGSFTYDNMADFSGKAFKGEDTYPSFVNYVDGIYVGYRFYETAAEEGLIDYDNTVVYPFGYGLSYTGFTQKMGALTEADGMITFDVTVTNTGEVAGKDVVQVYYNPPYTNGGMEKASANLAAFKKTGLIKPGETETITISFGTEDMASYDSTGTGGYVLDAGDYGISIRNDSHRIIEEQTMNVPSQIVYNESNPRSTDEVAAVNQFKEAKGDLKVLSRADGFSNYKEVTAPPKTMTMPEEYKKTFVNNKNYDPKDYNDPADEMPVTGAKNGLTLASMRGLPYDDPQWEKLLDQLTVTEMDTMVAIGGYQTSAAKSVKKVGTVDCDGPASINNNFTGVGSIGFPSAVMIACTWNEDIAKAFGESIGAMADEMDVSGWYAPAMNTHRSAFGGRNFEYYSEDGLLGGKMAASALKGAEEHGVYGYIKHFALNDQETNRLSMLCTWSEEQAIREIYLKPFEIAVKEGGAKAVMSSFNYIGTEYAGASSALLKTVLRGEWGFQGFVLTDYFGGYGYQNADQEIRNGNDAMLVAYDTETNHLKDTESATSIKAMRQSAKNIMYTVVNSRAYEGNNAKGGLMSWQILAIGIDVILAAGLVYLELFMWKRYKAKRESEVTEEAVLEGKNDEA